MTNESIAKPIYQKIAIDIASRVAAGDFEQGDKLYGRSVLASQYNVSPETIRRAVILLSDMDIVEVTRGSGIFIKSIDNSFKFIDKFKDIDSMNSLRKEVIDLLEEKKEMEKKIEDVIVELVDYSNRFKNSSPFIPLELEIHGNFKFLDKTIGESKFWQNTGATIIGIKRKEKLLLSPGPYAVFNEKDILMIVGDEDTYYRVKKFLYEE
jgi:K+/H+ antiporter YhaU regulatory subunit KhtT